MRRFPRGTTLVEMLDYLACTSGTVTRESGPPPLAGRADSNGIFYVNSGTRLADIVDGSSNTVAVGETVFIFRPHGADHTGLSQYLDHWYIGTAEGDTNGPHKRARLPSSYCVAPQRGLCSKLSAERRSSVLIPPKVPPLRDIELDPLRRIDQDESRQSGLRRWQECAPPCNWCGVQKSDLASARLPA